MRVGSQQKRDERIEVLSNEAIRDVKLGAPTVVGATPGTTMSDGTNIDNSISRENIDLVATAPIIGDATTRGETELPPDAETKKIRRFRVMNQNGKHVNEPQGGGRVFLHEGKEISTQHYDVRKLQQQGVRLKEVTDLEADDIVTD